MRTYNSRSVGPVRRSPNGRQTGRAISHPIDRTRARATHFDGLIIVLVCCNSGCALQVAISSSPADSRANRAQVRAKPNPIGWAAKSNRAAAAAAEATTTATMATIGASAPLLRLADAREPAHTCWREQRTLISPAAYLCARAHSERYEMNGRRLLLTAQQQRQRKRRRRRRGQQSASPEASIESAPTI